jgi:MFS family permease
MKGTWWPDAEERHVLGRFYLADAIGETLNVIFPFQFVYFLLVMEEPEWAIVPFVVGEATVLLMEIPTGFVADRWGRKVSVIGGGLLFTAACAMIPLSVSFSGAAQLVTASLCFVAIGLGTSLESGAGEAWVVDNIMSRGKPDMLHRYFSRVRSFTAFGGAIAGVIALVLLVFFEMERGLLDALWYVAAAGFLLSVLVALTIPEDETEEAPPTTTLVPTEASILERFKTFMGARGTVVFTVAVAIATFSGSVADATLDLSLITRGMDARGLAPLGIADDLVGLVAPLIGIALARRFGATRLMVLFLALPALVVLFLLAHPGIAGLLAIYLFFDFVDDVWDPLADARLHQLIDSERRATVASIVNLLCSLAELVGLALLGLLIDHYSEGFDRALPNLVDAFSGTYEPVAVPAGWLGVPVQDLALVGFIVSGLVAVPFLIWSRRREKEAQNG